MPSTPEAEVTSTVISTNSSSSNESERSTDQQITQNTPHLLPPTTIVCFPNMMTLTQQSKQSQSNIVSINSMNAVNSSNTPTTTSSLNLTQPKHFSGIGATATNIITKNNQQQSQVYGNVIRTTDANELSIGENATYQRTIVASSSSLPYLQLQTSQQIRNQLTTQSNSNAICLAQSTSKLIATTKPQPKIPIKGGRGSRINNNRPPPGAVNLERSYQICQAVIQNSPNRHQLKAQLRPPPSLLATVNNSTGLVTNPTQALNKQIIKRDGNISSSTNRIVYKVMSPQIFFLF